MGLLDTIFRGGTVDPASPVTPPFINPALIRRAGGLSVVPGLPAVNSSYAPNVEAATPNPTQNPNVTTGSSATTGAGPVETHPAVPSPSTPTAPPTPIAPTSTLDQVMDRDRTTIDAARAKVAGLPSAPEKASLWSDPNHGHLRTLLTLFGGGIRGGITGDVKEGLDVMQPALQQPQHEADKRWQDQRTSAEREYENAIQGFNVDLAGSKAKSEEADRAAQEQLRKKQLDEIDDRLKGGPEQRRIDMENKDRATKAEDMRRAGYSDREIAEFNATGRIEKAPPIGNDVELLMKAHEVGPDGKPTPAALQAAEAHKQHRQDELDKIHAMKDPNEKVKLWKDLQTNDVAKRGQLEHELTSIEGNILSKNDPAAQARSTLIRQQIDAIDKDLEQINGEIKKGVGLPNQPPATPTNAPNYTVSAPGKPAVKKFLTPEQAKTLQDQGVQLAPIQQP